MSSIKHSNQIRKIIRTDIRRRRNALSQKEQLKASENLLQQLTRINQIQSAKTIVVYLANDGEIDTNPFIQWCWQQNKNVCLPVLHPFTKGNLLFLRYDQHTKMTKNKFGILEPKLNLIDVILLNNIDVICTPLVAFDDAGNRLGMGGGFYDRTLSSWYNESKKNKAAKPYPLGLAHDCQQVDEIPTELWDIPIPKIVTPSKIIRTK